MTSGSSPRDGAVQAHSIGFDESTFWSHPAGLQACRSGVQPAVSAKPLRVRRFGRARVEVAVSTFPTPDKTPAGDRQFATQKIAHGRSYKAGRALRLGRQLTA